MAIEKFDQLLKTRQSIARRNKIIPLRKIVRFALSFRMIFLAENERRENLQRRKCWEIGIERSFRSNLQNARTYCHRRSKKNTHKNRRTKEKKKKRRNLWNKGENRATTWNGNRTRYLEEIHLVGKPTRCKKPSKRHNNVHSQQANINSTFLR